MDNSRVKATIFFIEKYHFLWIFSLVIFMGDPSLRLSEVLSRREELVQIRHGFHTNKSHIWAQSVKCHRYESDCRSRGRELDPGPVPYFRGDWSWNNFYCHSPPFRRIIQEGLLSVTSESMCTKYWLTACSSLSRKKVWLGELTVPPWL